MSDDEFTDSYGFTGGLPVTSTQRMIPTGEFHPGLAIGQPAPDFELPNHLGETVSFHADRDGARAALLFYRSAVWWPPCLTQLVELHNGLPELAAEGIKLYAVSYDDTEALRDYVETTGVEFTLLSDVTSEVIRQYEVFNTIVQPDDVPFYGVPFPGFFLLDEDGVIVDKLFNRHFAHRDGVEAILDSYAGRVAPGANEPIATASEDDGISVTAFLRGGGGVFRVGPRRRLVVRVEMPDGLHIYGEPVPAGMVATEITVAGPEGFRHDLPTSPPTHAFELPGITEPLHVWDGTVDFVMDVWGDSTMAAAIAAGTESIEVAVTVRYQACDDNQCFIPRSRTLQLEVPLAVSTRPNFSRARELPGAAIDMDSAAHMKRLIERKTQGGPPA